MILITGANGHLGTLTAHYLTEQHPDLPVAGLVRSEKKGSELKKSGVEIRIGDYNNPDSLNKAMKGIDTLMFISSSTLEGRVKQHKHVIESAKKAGVRQIFYTSIVQADKRLSPLSADHHETEQLLTNAGLDFTIFRNTFYAEFFPMYLGNALETGTWAFPSGGARVNFAFRTEMAEALAKGLSAPREHKNRVYEITSGRAFIFNELAGIISKKTGKKIEYRDLSVDEFMKGLEGAGLDEATLAITRVSAETVVNGALSFTSNDLKNLLGREPKTLGSIISQIVNS